LASLPIRTAKHDAAKHTAINDNDVEMEETKGVATEGSAISDGSSGISVDEWGISRFTRRRGPT
jgi:hypothetical protein